MTFANGMKLVAGLAIGLTAWVVAGAADLPKGAVRITAEELKWRPGQVPGVEIADVIGASTKPGPFVERIKFPENFAQHAHSHPDDRTYTVISGTWYVGYGDKLDPAKLKALPAGSFHTEPANVNHFVMTKDGGVVVQITGTAPTGFKYVDPAHAPKKK